jgi:hypothetical protein
MIQKLEKGKGFNSRTSLWIHPNDLTTTTNSTDLNDYMSKSIFFWEPSVSKNEYIECPEEGCSGALAKEGWGRARLIYGLNSNYYLLPKKYKCNKCRKTVMSTEQRYIVLILLIRFLPHLLSAGF